MFAAEKAAVYEERECAPSVGLSYVKLSDTAASVH